MSGRTKNIGDRVIFEAYQVAVNCHKIEDSSAQRMILPSFQRILDQYLLKFLWRWKPVLGLYLQGSVGVGKTFLMDLFYQCITDARKERHHFHDFMQIIDQQLRQRQGQSDPLKKIAKSWSKKVRILCLDELLVEDIAHAMILAELLQALISNGVILVITSNSLPEQLYYNGLQRARFIPAINLLKQHCELCILKDNQDHRLGHDARPQSYIFPINEKNQALMTQYYMQLTENKPEAKVLRVENRLIPSMSYHGEVVWFSFQVLCQVPRSQLDYLSIAKRFGTIFLSGVSALSGESVILFIRLIDVLYDRGVRLLVYADVPLEELYLGTEYAEIFLRTRSRLIEMQSIAYWNKKIVPLSVGDDN